MLQTKKVCLFFIKNMVNEYIAQKLDTGSKDLNTDVTPGKSLFHTVKLSKNADLDEYRYDGHGTVLD